MPFDDDNVRKLLTKVKNGVFSIPHFIANDAKDLIVKMLNIEPNQRIKIEDIKKHPWVLSNMKEFEFPPFQSTSIDEMVQTFFSKESSS